VPFHAGVRLFSARIEAISGMKDQARIYKKRMAVFTRPGMLRKCAGAALQTGPKTGANLCS